MSINAYLENEYGIDAAVPRQLRMAL